MLLTNDTVQWYKGWEYTPYPSTADHQTKLRLFLRIEACRLKSCSPDSLKWSNSTKPTTGGVLVKSVEQLV